MRKGRCRYPVAIMVRSDSALREAAADALQRRGISLSEFVRDQLRELVAADQAGSSRQARAA